ncbi:MAG: hypothetical protein HKN73_13860 [Gemmatimonadetes bacterium]|nr:hypothetical protein [Gemmatimonadota bacterium]
MNIDQRSTPHRSIQTLPNRRTFLVSVGRVAAVLAFVPRSASALAATEPLPFPGHPEPRPDVDGSLVLPREKVAPRMGELFDGIREIPHIADGLGCHCGCGFIEGMRSLLSCYEGVGMAQGCHICEGEGRLAVRLAREGASLTEIREAIDRAYG